MSTHRCPGCRKTFNHTGLLAHVAQTQDKRCATLLQQLYEIPEVHHDQFQGDFFGDNYPEGFFPGFSDNEDLLEDEWSESEPDEEVASTEEEDIENIEIEVDEEDGEENEGNLLSDDAELQESLSSQG